MAGDEPEKSETEPVAAPVLAMEEGRKTPDGVAPSDPSPPRLAPEAPTTSLEKNDEETEEEKKDDKPPPLSMPISPPDEPPTLVRAAPQPQTSPPPQLLPALPPPPQQAVQPPPQITPHAPPQGKPRGRPPGVPNRATVVANQQVAIQKQHQQQQATVAQQMAHLMHQNGHAMHMGPVMQMQDGQFVQMIQGQSGQQQMIQIINPNMQGRPVHRFNVSQMQQRPPPNQQQRPPQNGQNGGSNGGLVPVLIPVTSGQAPNPIPVPVSALVKHPDGSFHLRPEFLPNTMVHVPVKLPDGKQGFRQVQIAPNQMAIMQNMMAAKGQQMGMNQQMIFQQRPGGGGGDMPHLQQQLTRQNLPHQDRLATTSSAAAAATTSAAASRTSDWVGGLPPPVQIIGGMPSTSMPTRPISQPHGVPYWSPPLHPEVVEMDDEDKEAAPQLHAEGTDRNLNMESLNAEEAFHKESQGGSGRKKKERNAHKAVIEEIVDGYKICELPEPTNSAHLDATDYEPVNEDDDDSDKSYEGKDEDGSSSRRRTNGAVLGHQASEWMRNRLEMDKPRVERKSKVTPPPQKPSTRSDGKPIKRGKQKANELKSLLQMDFGPAENSRRAEVLPKLIDKAESAKTRAETLKETPKQSLRGKERRLNSAAGGSVAASTSGKETRSLRHRDSIEKLKECKACGKSIDEKKGKKQHAGYCNADCCESSPLYRLLVSGKNVKNRIATSASPSNSDEEEDDRTSVTIDRTPEPKKESSTAPTSGSKRVIKEEPVEEAPTTATTTPKRKGRTTKKEEEVVTPKKDITQKKDITPKKDATPKKDITPKADVTPKKDITPKTDVSPKKDITPKTDATPKKDEKKKVEKIKEEPMDEEKQQSPPHKRKSIVEKKEEPQTKTRKVETTARETPSAIVAALAAPSVFPNQPPVVSPPPQQPRVQQQQQSKPPAPRAEVAPSPQATGASSSSTEQEMDVAAFRAMSIEQVRDWVTKTTGRAEDGQKFEAEDIDGSILFDLTYDDLRNDLKVTLGLAKRVRQEIDDIIRRSQME